VCKNEFFFGNKKIKININTSPLKIACYLYVEWLLPQARNSGASITFLLPNSMIFCWLKIDDYNTQFIKKSVYLFNIIIKQCWILLP